MRNITAILAIIFILSGPIFASQIKQVSLEKVTKGSEFIFEGKAISKENQISPETGQPFTVFSFEVKEVLKGEPTDKVVELKFLGGVKDGFLLKISDMEMPQINEEGIYFVESLKKQTAHPLYGWDQGHYLLFLDKSDGQRKVVNKKSSPKLREIAPTAEIFKRSIRNILKAK